ncbi:hypothetical protein [Kosakonia cowanii]|jgi:hypothetical protein|uniref:hypothetical protein n=1 Tax=Kosakonia cowanii TaxID=208223 RepID=UPI0028A01446|nr:hypothetical protein [Kosakonia cowanii]
MSNELKYKISCLFKTLHPDKENKAASTDEIQDILEAQVLAYLLLAKSVSVIDSSFVANGIKGLSQYNKNFHCITNRFFLKKSESDFNPYEIEKYLGYLTTPKKGLLNLQFVYFDEEFEREHIVTPDVIVKSLKSGCFYHPVTQEIVKEFKNKVYPVYFPTKKLEKLRISFTLERECEHVYEPVASHNRDDRKKRARALRILR